MKNYSSTSANSGGVLSEDALKKAIGAGIKLHKDRENIKTGMFGMFGGYKIVVNEYLPDDIIMVGRGVFMLLTDAFKEPFTQE